MEWSPESLKIIVLSSSEIFDIATEPHLFWVSTYNVIEFQLITLVAGKTG